MSVTPAAARAPQDHVMTHPGRMVPLLLAVGLPVMTLGAFLLVTGQDKDAQIVVGTFLTVVPAHQIWTATRLTLAVTHSTAVLVFVGAPALLIDLMRFEVPENYGTTIVVLGWSYIIALAARHRIEGDWTGTLRSVTITIPVALVAVALSLAAGQIGAPRVLAGPITWCASLLLGKYVGDAVSNRFNRLAPIVGLLIGCGFYWTTAFSGSGRLQVASLALALVISIEPRTRMGLKQGRLLLLAVVPGLLISGLLRDEEASVADVARHGAGLGSVLSPTRDLALLLELDDSYGPVGAPGSTIWSSLVSPVPRSVWQDKPYGFGAEAAERLYPGSNARNHSIAPLLHGEVVWSFGKPFMLFADGVSILVLTKAACLIERRYGGTNPLGSIAAVVLVSGYLDLYWVGTFTFMARTGFRLFWMIIILRSVSLVVSGQRRTVRPGSAES